MSGVWAPKRAEQYGGPPAVRPPLWRRLLMAGLVLAIGLPSVWIRFQNSRSDWPSPTDLALGADCIAAGSPTTWRTSPRTGQHDALSSHVAQFGVRLQLGTWSSRHDGNSCSLGATFAGQLAPASTQMWRTESGGWGIGSIGDPEPRLNVRVVGAEVRARVMEGDEQFTPDSVATVHVFYNDVANKIDLVPGANGWWVATLPAAPTVADTGWVAITANAQPSGLITDAEELGVQLGGGGHAVPTESILLRVMPFPGGDFEGSV